MKQKLIDALIGYNIPQEEISKLNTNQKLSDKLSEIRIKELAQKEPERIDVKITEVTRSHSRRVPGEGYHNYRDYFCSMKAEVGEEDPSKISAELAFRCIIEVEKQISNQNAKPF